jgi:hypothetical protein
MEKYLPGLRCALLPRIAYALSRKDKHEPWIDGR